MNFFIYNLETKIYKNQKKRPKVISVSAKLRSKIAMFKKISLVPFLAIIEAMALLANNLIMLGRLIWSFRHLEYQNWSIISDSIGRYRML